MKIINGKGLYFSSPHDTTLSCQFSFEVKSNQLLIKTLDDKGNCGFGYGVYIDGAYKRYSRNVPDYFEDETGIRMYFKKTLPDNWNAP